MTMCEDFALNSDDKRTGCCITTAHCLTLFFSPGNFFAKNNMTVIPHLPYFSLFPRLKIKMKCHHFDATEVMEAESQAVLNTLAKHDYKDAFRKQQKCWEWCIHAEGDYFEGVGGQ
jgi:hypothetical protein